MWAPASYTRDEMEFRRRAFPAPNTQIWEAAHSCGSVDGREVTVVLTDDINSVSIGWEWDFSPVKS